MIDNCLLRLLPLLRVLLGLQRGRDEALTVHFPEIAPTSAFAISPGFPCGVLRLIPYGDP
jgi:hypothetical protein